MMDFLASVVGGRDVDDEGWPTADAIGVVPAHPACGVPILYVPPMEMGMYTPVLLESPTCSSDGSYCIAMGDLGVYTTTCTVVYDLAVKLAAESATTGATIDDGRWSEVFAALQDTDPLDE